ncbi:hypothetical protein GCM10009529_23910 [Micropruina glycogenica]
MAESVALKVLCGSGGSSPDETSARPPSSNGDPEPEVEPSPEPEVEPSPEPEVEPSPFWLAGPDRLDQRNAGQR